MSRKYAARVDNVTVTAAQDFFQLVNATTKVAKIHEIRIAQDGSVTNQMCRVRLSRLTGTITNGSGGSTPTASKYETGDSAAAATFIGANNTTQATATAKTSILDDAFSILSGFLYMPQPEDQIVLAPGEGLVAELLTVSGTLTMDGSIVWEEIG